MQYPLSTRNCAASGTSSKRRREKGASNCKCPTITNGAEEPRFGGASASSSEDRAGPRIDLREMVRLCPRHGRYRPVDVERAGASQASSFLEHLSEQLPIDDVIALRRNRYCVTLAGDADDELTVERGHLLLPSVIERELLQLFA